MIPDGRKFKENNHVRIRIIGSRFKRNRRHYKCLDAVEGPTRAAQGEPQVPEFPERNVGEAEGIRQGEWKKEFALKEQEVGASIDMMNFNKRQTFLDTVLAQFNRKPGLVNNFAAAQRGRK